MRVSAETFGFNYISWSSYSESAFTVFLEVVLSTFSSRDEISIREAIH